MKFLDYFKKTKLNNTAVFAKERLQIIIAHSKVNHKDTSIEYLPALQQEILTVLKKYVEINEDQVSVKLEHIGDSSVLELNVTIPTTASTEEEID